MDDQKLNGKETEKLSELKIFNNAMTKMEILKNRETKFNWIYWTIFTEIGGTLEMKRTFFCCFVERNERIEKKITKTKIGQTTEAKREKERKIERRFISDYVRTCIRNWFHFSYSIAKGFLLLFHIRFSNVCSRQKRDFFFFSFLFNPISMQSDTRI